MRLSLIKYTMIVCLCTGATDRDVNEAIDDGARCVCDFRQRGIGTSCGACHETIRYMMESRGVAVRELCFEDAILARMGGRPLEPVRPETTCPSGVTPS